MSKTDVINLLYAIGCEYGISDDAMQRLCAACGVAFTDLMVSTGV